MLADGRWNRAGEYGCLYTSLSREGAVAEYEKMLKRFGLAPEEDQRRDLVTVRVTVSPILDLTDRKVHQELGIPLDALLSDKPADLEFCRAVADLARGRAYRAILSPSAARKGAHNLNIYLEGPARQPHLAKGPTRESLNYSR